jgi:hypothetical protein
MTTSAHSSHTHQQAAGEEHDLTTAQDGDD